MHHLNEHELDKYEEPRSLVSVLLRQPLLVTLPSFSTEAVEVLLRTPRTWIHASYFSDEVPQLGGCLSVLFQSYLF